MALLPRYLSSTAQRWLGAYDFVSKPFELNDIVLTAERALEHVRLNRELVRLRDAITTGPEEPVASGMAGSTPAMLEVFKLVGRVASSESTVLAEHFLMRQAARRLGIQRRLLYAKMAEWQLDLTQSPQSHDRDGGSPQ